VILVDANLLVYSFSSDMPEHTAALPWLEGQFASGGRLALPWESLNAFLRLVSNPRIFPKPVAPLTAWGQVENWLNHPGTWVPVPTDQHASIMGELYRDGSFAANDAPDVHLAALAISHGLRLATHDAGFARFAGLRWFDPIA
jgi:toxin-antitoxin system PIN domain toxin